MTRRLERAASRAALVLLMTAGMAGQTHGDPEEFSAFAINMGAYTGTGGTAQLLMTVNHWARRPSATRSSRRSRRKARRRSSSSCAARSAWARCGRRASIGYDIRLALEEPGKDGGRRVLLLTDRPIGFSEATNRPISIDYPFTVIDMQIPPKGYGQGTLAIAAKIIPAGKTVLIENYDTQPVQLNRIETRKLTKK